MENSPPKKRIAKHFTVEDKGRVLNIFKMCETQPGTSKVTNVEMTARAAGIGERSVYNILKEYNATHEFSPPKRYHRKRAVLDNVDDETRNNIRRIVHAFFFKNEPPTAQKVLTAINERTDLPNFKMTSLRSLLKELNFRYQRRNRNSILKEKDEIITWRRKYLRQIMKYRQNKTPIYYLDETWVNAGHTVSKVWTDTSIVTARQAFVEGLSTGLKNPSGKGKRFIILHIGSDEGFVESGLLLFESKKTGDYHDDMNAERFEEWLQQILPNLQENCVIILDNASYHSRKLNKLPTANSRKSDIQEWMRKNNIVFEEDMVKAELLTLIRENTSGPPKYAVDDLVEKSNRTVLRLPPYHCELNPIELIWAQVKGYVARRNTTFKLADVKELFLQGINDVSPDNWRNAIGHIIETEKRMWELDNLIDVQVEPLIITNDDTSETSSLSEDE